jgi:hypothetical protein
MTNQTFFGFEKYIEYLTEMKVPGEQEIGDFVSLDLYEKIAKFEVLDKYFTKLGHQVVKLKFLSYENE